MIGDMWDSSAPYARAFPAPAGPEALPYFCGSVEQFGDGTPALKLATNRPLVMVQDALPGFSRDVIWSWFVEAHARWGSVCDWQARRIMDMSEAGPNDFVNLITVADLGPSGVLADQMLPYSGGNVLRMRINSRISWHATDGRMPSGKVDPLRTLTHELGHFQGHAHWPVGEPTELMEPTISHVIIGPQPTEARMSANWFGVPIIVTPPPTGDTAKDVRWLRQLYKDLFGRDAAAGDVEAWLPVTNRAKTVRNILNSAEYHLNLVTGWYRAHLRREPDNAGLANFANSLNQGMHPKDALAVMLASDEYYNRAAANGGAPGTDPVLPTPTPLPGDSIVKEIVTLIVTAVMSYFKSIPFLGRFITDAMIQKMVDLLMKRFGLEVVQLSAPLRLPLVDIDSLVAEIKAEIGELPTAA